MCLCGLNPNNSFISKSKTVDYLDKEKIRNDEIADYMKANYFFSNLG